MRLRSFLFAAALALPAGACGFNNTHYSNGDARAADARTVDGSVIDATSIDASLIDATVPDATVPDADVSPDAATCRAPGDTCGAGSQCCTGVCDGSSCGACQPGCSGSDEITCPDGAGGAPLTIPCDLGCSTTGAVHCKQLVPSNGVSLNELATVTAGWTLVGGATTTINSNTGSVNGGAPPAGAHFAVVGTAPYAYGLLALDSLTIEEGATLVVRGTLPLIILSRGDVVIHGQIDAAANMGTTGNLCLDGSVRPSCEGPGGGRGGYSQATPATGCGAGGDGPYSAGNYTTGGGGGALAQAGANAGQTAGQGGSGGTAVGCTGPTLIPLEGGSGGGGAQQNTAATPIWSAGGSGGGALQITSLTSISIVTNTLAAYIDVTGAGGQGTRNISVSGTIGGGGGGGAGGAVLLEAPSVTLSHSAIYGGGGGGGAGSYLTGGLMDGQWGQRSEAVAVGGVGTPAQGVGGAGGAFVSGALVAPVAGGSASAGNGTGGGGGGAGRLRVNVYNGQLTQTNVIATTSTSIGSISTQ